MEKVFTQSYERISVFKNGHEFSLISQFNCEAIKHTFIVKDKFVMQYREFSLDSW